MDFYPACQIGDFLLMVLVSLFFLYLHPLYLSTSSNYPEVPYSSEKREVGVGTSKSAYLLKLH